MDWCEFPSMHSLVDQLHIQTHKSLDHTINLTNRSPQWRDNRWWWLNISWKEAMSGQSRGNFWNTVVLWVLHIVMFTIFNLLIYKANQWHMQGRALGHGPPLMDAIFFRSYVIMWHKFYFKRQQIWHKIASKDTQFFKNFQRGGVSLSPSTPPQADDHWCPFGLVPEITQFL